jgi:peptidoglycan/LPS O-acetylase OafA/YrhL
MKRSYQLDGLRALAILMVMGRHYAGMPYGWAGVDLFFVLSGFLITGILRRERLSDDYWRSFYIKRATRILPIMVVTTLIGIKLFPVPIHQLYPYYVLFLANEASLHHSGQVYSLSVLWSLSVEEHFYLLWPLAVRFISRRKLVILLAIVLIIEPIVRGVVTPHLATFWPIYYLTPFRMDGLAAGSLLALLNEGKLEWMERYSGPGFLATLAAFSFLSMVPSFNRDANSTWFNSLGYSMLVAISFLAVAHLVTRPQSPASGILARAPAVYIGSISYGLYLIHPLFAPLAHHVLGKLAAGVISIGLAALSFRFLEAPIIRWGRSMIQPPRTIVDCYGDRVGLQALE